MQVFQKPGFIAGFSEASDGNLFLITLSDEEARAAWKKAINAVDDTLPFPRFHHQVHGSKATHIPANTSEGLQVDADALTTSAKGMPIGVFTADCLPVLFAAGDVVGAIHAGWKGTRENITGKTIAELCRTHGKNPGECQVFMGPCIGQCCLELGEEIPPTFFAAGPLASGCFTHGRKWHLDLRALNVMQCLQEGVRPENIQHVPDCTKCFPDRYFSYRHQKGMHSKGMFSFIMRR